MTGFGQQLVAPDLQRSANSVWSGGALQDFGDNSFLVDQMASECSSSLSSSVEARVEGQTDEATSGAPAQYSSVNVTVAIDWDGQQVMSDAILRGVPFAYSEKLLEHLHGDRTFQFFVCAPKKTTAATLQELQAWGKDGAKVNVHIDGAMVGKLHEYKFNFLRSSGLTDNMTANNGDQLVALLTRVASGDASALDELVALAKKEPTVTQAVVNLAASPQGKTAMVQIAAAKLLASSSTSDFVGPLSDEQLTERRTSLGKVEGLVDTANGLTSTDNRQEAAAVNLQAASIYGSMAQDGRATTVSQESARRKDEAEWLAQMNQSTSAETRGDPRLSPFVSKDTSGDKNVMRVPGEAEKRLTEWYRLHPNLDPSQTQAMPEQDADGDSPNVSARLTIQKQISTKSGPGYVTTGILDMNASGSQGAKTASNVGGMVDQFNRWTVAHLEMLRYAELSAERSALQKAVREEETYAKPPFPDEVQASLNQVSPGGPFGRLTEAQAPGIDEVRRRLRVVLAGSVAFWQGRRHR